MLESSIDDAVGGFRALCLADQTIGGVSQKLMEQAVIRRRNGTAEVDVRQRARSSRRDEVFRMRQEVLSRNHFAEETLAAGTRSSASPGRRVSLSGAKKSYAFTNTAM